MAVDGLTHYEDEGSITIDESIAKTIVIKRVRAYFRRFQEDLSAVRKEARTIRIPKTEFTYSDWADAEAAVIIIEKLVNGLLIHEDMKL